MNTPLVNVPLFDEDYTPDFTHSPAVWDPDTDQPASPGTHDNDGGVR